MHVPFPPHLERDFAPCHAEYAGGQKSGSKRSLRAPAVQTLFYSSPAATVTPIDGRGRAAQSLRESVRSFLARASARRRSSRSAGAGHRTPATHAAAFRRVPDAGLPGALLGVWFARLSGPWILICWAMSRPKRRFTRPNLAVLCVTVACAVFCALLFGMAPAWTAGIPTWKYGAATSHPVHPPGARPA